MPNDAMERCLPPRGEPRVSGGIIQAVAATSASQMVVVGLAFVASIAQARVLGAEGRGDVARFANAAGLAVLYLGLGLSSAITYFVASGRAHPTALVRSLLPTLATTVAATAVVTALAYAVGLGRYLPQSTSTLGTILALTLFFSASQVSAWASGLLAARMAFGPINASALLVAVVGAAGSVALLAIGPPGVNAATVIALLIVLEMLRAGALLVVLRPGSAFAARHLQFGHGALQRLPGVGPLWRYSSLSYVADAIQFLTYRVDMWLVDAFRGGADLGRYALAVSLSQLVWIVPTALGRVFFPFAAGLDAPEAGRLARRAAIASLAISLVAGLVGWIGSHLFVTSLFGEDFRDVPGLIGILLLGVVPYSVARVLGNYLAAIGAVGDNLRASAAVLVVTIALDLALVPTMGATGAAWASACSYLIFTAIVVGLFARRRRAEG